LSIGPIHTAELVVSWAAIRFLSETKTFFVQSSSGPGANSKAFETLKKEKEKKQGI
jgi:hypothetical protein